MHPIERLRYVSRAGPVPMTALVQESASALTWFADDPMGLVTSCRRLIDRRPGCGPLIWLAARMLTGTDPAQEARDAITEIRCDRTAKELEQNLPAKACVVLAGRIDIAAGALSQRPDLEIVADWDRFADLAYLLGLPGIAEHTDRADRGSRGIAEQTDRGLRGIAEHTDRADRGSRGIAEQTDRTDRCSPSSALGMELADLLLIESDCVGPEQALVTSDASDAAQAASAAGVDVWLVAGVGRMLPAPLWQSAVASVESDVSYRPDDGLDDRHHFDVINLQQQVTRVVTPMGLCAPERAHTRSPGCPTAPELLM